MVDYKQHLIEGGYAIHSVNSMPASLNSLFALPVDIVKVAVQLTGGQQIAEKAGGKTYKKELTDDNKSLLALFYE